MASGTRVCVPCSTPRSRRRSIASSVSVMLCSCRMVLVGTWVPHYLRNRFLQAGELSTTFVISKWRTKTLLSVANVWMVKEAKGYFVPSPKHCACSSVENEPSCVCSTFAACIASCHGISRRPYSDDVPATFILTLRSWSFLFSCTTHSSYIPGSRFGKLTNRAL